MQNHYKNEHIVFVILHYMAKEATIKCVETIRKKIDTNNYKIIIVDNASANGTGKELLDLYQNEQSIEVIINKENLGFAKGNNVGFQYAKSKYNPQYIVLLNNDVYLLEDNLVSKLDTEYNRSKFAVLGPLIMTKDGRCDINPVPHISEKKEIQQRMKKMKHELFFFKCHLMRVYVKGNQIIQKVRNRFNKNTPKFCKDYLKYQCNVQLHGCFLVFSQEYMKKFDGLDDRTFLYMEEDILYKHVIENGLITIYAPNIMVYHEEDVSTDAVIMNERKKAEFIYKNHIDSCKVLLEIYDDYSK